MTSLPAPYKELPAPSCVVLPSPAPGDSGAVLRLCALLGVPAVLVLGGMGSARRNKAGGGMGWENYGKLWKTMENYGKLWENDGTTMAV